MKKYKGILFIISIICMLLSACLPKPIDIGIEPYQPKLVVASQIIPGKTMIVALTKSFSALSNSTQGDTVPAHFLDSVLVSNALVTVSYLGNTDTLWMVTPGIYASINTLQYSYGTYSLYAKDPATGLEISAVSTLLPKVSFDTVYPAITRLPGDTSIKVKFEFNDLSEKNWYAINYYVKRHGTGFDINSIFSVGSNKILTELELLSDLTFSDPHYVGETLLSGIGPTDTIAVSIANISEGYFQFLTAYKRAGGLFNQITGEPVNYSSNVINGHGYFNTHYPDVRIFDLHHY
jgi:hypothetical protein